MEHLSNELLLSIFTEVYHASRTHQTGNSAWNDYEYDLSSPVIFPYSVAAVCRRWRGAMESQAEFWTRIISILDCPEALTRAQRHLVISKGRDLDFHLIRRPRAYSDTTEAQLCRPFIDFVMKNLRRFRSINFFLVHGSSLPSIACNFHGNAPRLTSLTLKAHINDASNANHESVVHHPSFLCPKLAEINIDTLNFIYAHRFNKSWGASLSSKWSSGTSSLISLTLSPSFLAFQGYFTYMHLVDILAQIPRLDELTLDGITFDHLFPEKRTHSLLLSSLTLKRLSADLVNYILKSVEFPMIETVVVSQCKVAGRVSAPARSVTLDRINADPRMLCTFLDGWGGSHLKVVHCPGFDREVVEFLVRGKAAGAILEVEDCDGTQHLLELA